MFEFWLNVNAFLMYSSFTDLKLLNMFRKIDIFFNNMAEM